MSDNDILGQFQRLVIVCQSPAWISVWEGLEVEVTTFAEFGLSENAPDTEVWRICQENDIILVTGNRSAKEPESLEQTIRTHADSQSLPVITLGDSDRILHDAAYAERAAERLLEFLLDSDDLRGAGRLYIP